MIEQVRKDIPFEASWSFRKVIENSAIENINPCIHKATGIAVSLFRKATHTTFRGHLDRPISHFILHSKHGHSCYPARLAMRIDSLSQVNFHEGITVHHQEVGG